MVIKETSDLDEVNKLFFYLTDEEIPEGVFVKARPKLSVNKAWWLIWFLQEVMNCLPSNIEKCDRCNRLYDITCEGFILDDQYELNGKILPKKYWGFFCDSCVPDIDFSLR